MATGGPGMPAGHSARLPELDEVMNLSDRILVMYGEIVSSILRR